MKRSFSLFLAFLFVFTTIVMPLNISAAEEENIQIPQQKSKLAAIKEKLQDLNQIGSDSSKTNTGNRIQEQLASQSIIPTLNENSNESKSDRFIIKYKNESKINNIFDSLKSKIKNRHKFTNKKLEVFTTKLKLKKSELLALLKVGNLDKEIDYIQEDYQLSLSSNDPYFNQQWGVYNPETVKAKVTDSVYGDVYIDYHGF